MKITLLLRVPFLDKIPNLKTLIVDFAKKGVDITIISAVNENYPVSDLSRFSNVKWCLSNSALRGLNCLLQLNFYLLR